VCNKVGRSRSEKARISEIYGSDIGFVYPKVSNYPPTLLCNGVRIVYLKFSESVSLVGARLARLDSLIFLSVPAQSLCLHLFIVTLDKLPP